LKPKQKAAGLTHIDPMTQVAGKRNDNQQKSLTEFHQAFLIKSKK
jgi:hypothetical protein